MSEALVLVLNIISKVSVFLVLAIPLYFLLNYTVNKVLLKIGKDETIFSNIVVFMITSVFIINQINILNVY